MIATVVFAALVAAASPAPVSLPAVPVTGTLARDRFSFDATARATAPRVAVAATDANRSVATFGGVALAEILREAGAPIGDAVRGPAARAFVIVHATDGYAAVFSLAETQNADARCAPILADTRDGGALDATSGPLRIVAPCDLTHARWVHGVASLEIVVVPGASVHSEH